jgi:uncharacterized RDD family membrane protein YckC
MGFVPVGPAPVKLRLLAFAIDAALVVALAVAAGLAVAWWLAILVVLAGFPLLAALLLAAFGTTLGKRAAGIHVVAGDGGRPPLRTVLRRELWGRLMLEHALLLAGGAGVVGYGTGLRGGPPWHDVVAGTRVVGRERRARRSLAPEYVSEARAGPGGLELGGYLARVAAYLLDVGLVTTVWTALVLPLAVFTGQVTSESQQGVQFSKAFAIGSAIGLVLLTGFYGAIAIHLYETTIGKHAAGLAVRRSDGSRVGFKRALWRELGARELIINGLGSITGFVPLLDVLFPLWDGQSQALHDKMADTVVVKAGLRRRPRLDTGGAASDTDA